MLSMGVFCRFSCADVIWKVSYHHQKRVISHVYHCIGLRNTECVFECVQNSIQLHRTRICINEMRRVRAPFHGWKYPAEENGKIITEPQTHARIYFLNSLGLQFIRGYCLLAARQTIDEWSAQIVKPWCKSNATNCQLVITCSHNRWHFYAMCDNQRIWRFECLWMQKKWILLVLFSSNCASTKWILWWTLRRIGIYSQYFSGNKTVTPSELQLGRYLLCVHIWMNEQTTIFRVFLLEKCFTVRFQIHGRWYFFIATLVATSKIFGTFAGHSDLFFGLCRKWKNNL